MKNFVFMNSHLHCTGNVGETASVVNSRAEASRSLFLFIHKTRPCTVSNNDMFSKSADFEKISRPKKSLPKCAGFTDIRFCNPGQGVLTT